MKRVALLGYYGFNNAGDEAILYSVLRTIRQEDESIEFIVFSNNPEKTAKTYNVKTADRWKPWEIIKNLWKADILVLGGGSLLQDVTSAKSLSFYLLFIKLARLMRKPVYLYGQGIGPLYQKASQEKVHKILNSVNYITVRDEKSKELLQELKVSKPKIELTADAVLSLYREDIEISGGGKILERNGIQSEDYGKLIGFSLRDWMDLSDYKEKIASLADYLVENGYKVLFIPFHFPGDVTCAREVIKMMKQEATLIREECSTIEMLGLLNKMEILVGMRMHSLIMSAVMGVPSIGISYDPKIEATIKKLALVDGGRVENLQFDHLKDTVMEVLKDRENRKEELLMTVDSIRGKARRNSEILLELLAKR